MLVSDALHLAFPRLLCLLLLDSLTSSPVFPTPSTPSATCSLLPDPVGLHLSLVNATDLVCQAQACTTGCRGSRLATQSRAVPRATKEINEMASQDRARYLQNVALGSVRLRCSRKGKCVATSFWEDSLGSSESSAKKVVQESLEAAVDILHNMQRIRKNVKAKKKFQCTNMPLTYMRDRFADRLS